MKFARLFDARFRAVSTLIALACVLLQFLPQTAFSQQAGSAQNGSSTNSSTNSSSWQPTPDAVVQKKPQPADALPVSVTPVTRQMLENTDIQSVKEASVYAPNTFMQDFTARALSTPFFRGIGGSPLNPGVTTVIDGVPQLNGYSSSLELLDADQVDFVRGPQSALFGRNTAGGLINITSPRPANVWTGGGEGSFGNYDYRDLRGMVSGPITQDDLAMSLAGGYSARDGYTVNDFNGQNVDHREDEFGKGQLLFKASDRLEVRFIAFGEHDHDGDTALGDLNYIRANPNHVDYDFTGGFNHRDVASGTLLVNYFGETMDVSSITGGVWWKTENLTDLDHGVAIPAFPQFSTQDNNEEQRQFTQEFRLSSAKDKPVILANGLDLNWQSGVFLFSQSYDQALTDVINPPFGTGAPQPSAADLDDWGLGVYGQAKVIAWDKIDLTTGLRFDFEDKSADLVSSPGVAGYSSDTFLEVSPQFALAYHFDSNQLAYGTIARGYRAGGFNTPPVPAGAQEYGTEHSWNYELGYKAGWLDGKLETRLALFYTDWRSIQLSQENPVSPLTFFTANAGAADSEGVEFDVTYHPVAGWDLFGGVGYDKAKFLSGSTALNTLTGLSQNVGGNRLPYAPSFMGNMGTQVSWSRCQHATLYVRAEVTVTGDFVYDASNAQAQDTYSVADFRAGVRGDHWFAEGWVNNAFDQHYVPVAIQFNNPLGAPSGYLGESGTPLTFGARLGLQF